MMNLVMFVLGLVFLLEYQDMQYQTFQNDGTFKSALTPDYVPIIDTDLKPIVLLNLPNRAKHPSPLTGDFL